MSLHIELSAELRAEVEAFKVELAARLDAAKAARAEAVKNLELCQARERDLAGKISEIEQRGLAASDQELATLAASNVRLGLVREEIARAQAACDASEQLKVTHGAKGVLEDLRSWYHEHLPDVIAQHVAPLFQSVKDARRAVSDNQYAAIGSLGPMLVFIRWMPLEVSEDECARILAILDRALRGEPCIYFDGVKIAGPKTITDGSINRPIAP